MIPLRFGPEARQKYGVFQPAIGSGSKGRGIVICDGLFDEAVCAHRALKFAASSLAEARWNSLRFDYFGTGDSAGGAAEFSLAQALDDSCDAIDELKASAGLDAVYLLGLRLGGALAMRLAEVRDDVRGLVLWDPIIDGAEVLERYGLQDGQDSAGRFVEGFGLPPQARDELRDLSIEAALMACRKPLLMLCSAPTPRHRTLAQRRPDMDYREVEAPEAWSNTALGGVRPIPTAIVSEIRAWQA